MGHLRKFVKDETDRMNKTGSQPTGISLSQLGDESDQDGDVSPYGGDTNKSNNKFN